MVRRELGGQQERRKLLVWRAWRELQVRQGPPQKPECSAVQAWRASQQLALEEQADLEAQAYSGRPPWH
jgi:hypothetical protein